MKLYILKNKDNFCFFVFIYLIETCEWTKRKMRSKNRWITSKCKIKVNKDEGNDILEDFKNTF